ncbi:hypothetical protein ASE23_22850 [Rhizobium sp. Root73]|uniref:hypothetical protein n=1 Tax=unclassified Rhizobium TaxID=2613769 RepID=UPI0007284CEE|nr:MULTISPECIES: hypothetical protein [unclassified Rhizobium]KQY16754.1 hypothetical protein ASD36_22250 [Rhizobium sp. Root1334]KRC11317.1 hypothetical protein ASE23_22850 [Rhizobium sp. Root73]
MTTQFQIVCLSALDPAGEDRRDEPELSYSEALMRAEQLKFEGIAFRVYTDADLTAEQTQSLLDLGALM